MLATMLIAAAGCAASTTGVDSSADGWIDREGQPVSADVITNHPGSADCGWELIDFLTVGVPLGESIASTGTRTYIWDPVNFLSYVDGGVRNRTVLVRDLPSTVVESGFRRGETQLWFDPGDPQFVFLASGERADRYELDAETAISCE